MPVSESLKQNLAFVRETVMVTVESFPEDKLTATPIPNSRSFLEVALHICKSGWSLTNALTGGTDMPEHQFEPDSVKSKSSLLALLREGGVRTQQILASLTDEQLATTTHLAHGERSGLDIVHILLLHEADHNGNLVMLAKMAGVKPPDMLEVRKMVVGRPELGG